MEKAFCVKLMLSYLFISRNDGTTAHQLTEIRIFTLLLSYILSG